MAAVPNTDGDILVSHISLKRGNHLRSFKEARLAINKRSQDVEWQDISTSTQEAVFNPPLVISAKDQLTLSVCHAYGSATSRLLANTQEIKFPASDLLAAVSQDGLEGIREWRQVFDREEVVIRLSSSALVPPLALSVVSTGEASSSDELVPTTEDMGRECPRFRILVAGRAGVGKSSLINAAFGVKTAEVVKYIPGEADIDKPITSEKNPNFVLHDSRGFEPGEDANVNTIVQFIQRRNAESKLKDRLHAIWLCFAIPTAGGRVLETGVERILKMKQAGQLGDVPIIIVLTKYDDLVKRKHRDLIESVGNKHSPQDMPKLAEKKAEETVMQDCLEPLKAQIGTDVVHQIVSTKPSYKSTLEKLVQLTFDLVRKNGEVEATVVTAIAQKVNPDVKITGSIDVGRAKYWACLTASSVPGKKLQDYLKVVHADIIAVWAFNDPTTFLKSEEFRAKMSKLVHDETNQDPVHPNAALLSALPVIGAIGAAVGVLAGPAAPIATPVAGGIVGIVLFAKWVYDVCQYSQTTLARLMAYIIDLTLVMEILFRLLDDPKVEVTETIIQCAYDSYGRSSRMRGVHSASVEYTKEMMIVAPDAKDRTVSTIENLISKFRVGPEELAELKSKL